MYTCPEGTGEVFPQVSERLHSRWGLDQVGGYRLYSFDSGFRPLRVGTRTVCPLQYKGLLTPTDHTVRDP